MEFPAAPEAAEAPEVGNEAPAVSVSAVETETSPVVPAPEEHLWPCSNWGKFAGVWCRDIDRGDRFIFEIVEVWRS